MLLYHHTVQEISRHIRRERLSRGQVALSAGGPFLNAIWLTEDADPVAGHVGVGGCWTEAEKRTLGVPLSVLLAHLDKQAARITLRISSARALAALGEETSATNLAQRTRVVMEEMGFRIFGGADIEQLLGEGLAKLREEASWLARLREPGAPRGRPARFSDV